ncbi:MAG: elongation factor Tu [Methanosarcinales archaeon]|uniref:Elongation factor Tu n=1 Tax=Candidatus Ethanoperedens thermophilum TaxID=2766897 RepID=A0A848DA11_9EURY|nr:elongation factor Tu [Candidatus Ethanoperedens thermophilum]
MTKVAIIGSEQSGRTALASKLGKKGNVSDVTMYDFSKSGTVLMIVDATGYPKSIKPLVTALNLTDIVLLCIPPTGLDTYTGECIVALDILGCRHGIVVMTKSDLAYQSALAELKKRIRKITAGTVLENWDQIVVSTTTFEGMEELKTMIASTGEKVDEELARLNDLSPRVVIDQVFNVTGIGCVVLGVVKQGTIHAKDKITMMPVDKPIEIRSIQMHDVDVKTAAAGARVGLALKNIQSKDVDRGYVISNNETVTTDFTLNCTLSRFTKHVFVGAMLHLFAGLQSAPVRVEKIIANGDVVDYAESGSECVLTLSGSKNIAYTKSDRFILVNLDEKQRFVAYGFCDQVP